MAARRGEGEGEGGQRRPLRGENTSCSGRAEFVCRRASRMERRPCLWCPSLPGAGVQGKGGEVEVDFGLKSGEWLRPPPPSEGERCEVISTGREGEAD